MGARSLVFLFSLLFLYESGTGEECIKRDFGKGSFVCVCNATYCDSIPSVGPLAAGQATIITSTKESERFKSANHEFNDIPNSLDGIEISIDRTITYQSVIGFGGAFTDAAGINIAKLSILAQQKLVKSYYGPEGIEYGIGRVPMAGSDFSTHTYSYDDFAGDVELANFSLAEEDLVYKIPYIDWAKSYSQKPIKLFASPWTAPAWMKTNNEFYGEGSLKEEYYQVWANYFVKFLDSYKSHGLEFWGVTAQNEPIDGNIPGFSFNCMGWTAESQAMFVGLNLGPSLEQNGYGNVKIMILDDQRTMLPKWAETVLAHPEANRYVSGIGVHWYLDYLAPPTSLSLTHEMFPDRFILGTEACEGADPWELAVVLGKWERLENYAYDIITDLNHWVAGWVDWNLALDLGGGPNWANNFVDAPIIVDGDNDEFLRQPMFYGLGHISKYIPEDSVRIDLQIGNTTLLHGTAFQRPDGYTTVVLLNRAEEQKTIVLNDPERGVLEFTAPARSIQTIVYA